MEHEFKSKDSIDKQLDILLLRQPIKPTSNFTFRVLSEIDRLESLDTNDIKVRRASLFDIVCTKMNYFFRCS